MRKLLLTIFIILFSFSVDSFSQDIKLIYSKSTDSYLNEGSNINYFQDNLYWVLSKRKDSLVEYRTYLGTEQCVQKFNLKDNLLTSFPSVYCEDNQGLIARNLIIDSNSINVLSNYYLKVIFPHFINSRPRKTVYSHSGSLIFDKTDSLKGGLNLQATGNFIQFGDKLSFIFSAEPESVFTEDVMLKYDSELNPIDSVNIDKIRIIDDTLYNSSNIYHVTGSFEGKAYIGGSHSTKGVNSKNNLTQSFFVKLMDSTGHVEWEYRHPIGDENAPTSIYDIKLLHDNTVGILYFEKASISNKFMIISPEGKVLKDFVIGESGKAIWCKTFIMNSQHDILFAGKARFGSVQYYWITKYNLDGKKILNYYQKPLYSEDELNEIVEKNTNSYFLLSSTNSSDNTSVQRFNILEFTTPTSGIEETSSVTSAYWNGYSITVTGANNEEIEFAELYDITGRLVATQNGLSSGVFVPNMEIEPGAYILQLSNPKGKTAVKVMVR